MKKMISLGLRFEDHRLLVLDQAKLPHQEIWVDCRSCDQMIELIKSLAVRGAPLIGVAAALALGNMAESPASQNDLIEAAKKLRLARPTAVNLMAAVDRLMPLILTSKFQADLVVSEAEKIFSEDVDSCEAIANRGQEFIQDGDHILTHCNTGGLVTAGIGTALGVIHRAHQIGKKLHVYVDETRPLLQGARLTTWELEKMGIPFTLICDNMAGFLMSKGKVQKVFVGADRIAKNGDFANKIGTYGLAVLANFHQVPFYVAAPRTTFDKNCSTGEEIPIEERHPDEVRAGKAPHQAPVWNPAFDITPRKIISSIILDDAII